MKKYFPYILVLVVVASLVFVIARNPGPHKKINERVTLRQKDKIPYGTYVARTLLPELFPKSSIHVDANSPGTWDSIELTSYNQAVLLMAIDFDADKEELSTLLNFVKQGNYVMIVARTLSNEARKYFHLSYNEYPAFDRLNLQEDSLAISLVPPVFPNGPLFVYPGKKLASFFVELDTARTTVLGRNENHHPDFIALKTGNGNLFIHLAPLAFSNYFILHQKNINYYQHALSVIPATVKKMLWNEYYLNRPTRKGEGETEPNMLRVLMRYPAFTWGLLTGLLTLFLWALLGSRRRQRMIPLHKKPQNDSLVFVKTLGRLYHDRRDHQNLARKMGAYFLEHVRSVYKMPTNVLDEKFMESLHYKSGFPVADLHSIVSFINYLEQGAQIDERELSAFHGELELFYQNT